MKKESLYPRFPMTPKILIIDDDEKLTRLLSGFLRDFGFEIDSAHSPSLGFKQLQRRDYDLLILDIMLPEMDGFEVCKSIRRKSSLPIIMLTARGDVTDKVVGLELGADDYLAKPFEPRELVARINTVLRRSCRDIEMPHTFGRLRIDHKKRQVLLDDQVLLLTTNEFTVLAQLTANPGKVFDRDEILQQLKGMDSDAFNRTVDITISRLRQKIGDDPKNPQYIKTVWGAGYVFIGAEDDTN